MFCSWQSQKQASNLTLNLMYLNKQNYYVKMFLELQFFKLLNLVK